MKKNATWRRRGFASLLAATALAVAPGFVRGDEASDYKYYPDEYNPVNVSYSAVSESIASLGGGYKMWASVLGAIRSAAWTGLMIIIR